jgi:hypothetical protein
MVDRWLCLVLFTLVELENGVGCSGQLESNLLVETEMFASPGNIISSKPPSVNFAFIKPLSSHAQPSQQPTACTNLQDDNNSQNERLVPNYSNKFIEESLPMTSTNRLLLKMHHGCGVDIIHTWWLYKKCQVLIVIFPMIGRITRTWCRHHVDGWIM